MSYAHMGFPNISHTSICAMAFHSTMSNPESKKPDAFASGFARIEVKQCAWLTWAYPNMSHTTIGATAFNSTIIKPESKKPDAFASGFARIVV